MNRVSLSLTVASIALTIELVPLEWRLSLSRNSDIGLSPPFWHADASLGPLRFYIGRV